MGQDSLLLIRALVSLWQDEKSSAEETQVIELRTESDIIPAIEFEILNICGNRRFPCDPF